jgi:hypothetical protein
MTLLDSQERHLLRREMEEASKSFRCDDRISFGFPAIPLSNGYDDVNRNHLEVCSY